MRANQVSIFQELQLDFWIYQNGFLGSFCRNDKDVPSFVIEILKE
jgi:hypothetical protein